MKTSSIRIEGNIISPELFEKIDSTDILGQNATDFGFDRSFKVKDDIARAWADAKDQWNIFKRRTEKLSETQSGVEETRKFWIIPLLENLGYKLEYQRSSEVVNERSYAISHRVEALDNFPVHIMGVNDNLDKRRETGGPRMSPHALLQEYLNVTEHTYGIVTNGYFLRVLRDSGKLVRLSYLEFNLQRMLEDDLYAEFSIMYRLIHASRMPKKQTETDQSIFEQYHQDAIESGSRIREKLSQAVEESIKIIANGFLAHPGNNDLRNEIIAGTLKPEAYFQMQLRFIYRILFLLVIEERDIVYPDIKPDLSKEEKEKLLYHKNIYYSYYSVTRLRTLAEKIHFFDDKLDDLWISLKNTFNIFIEERFAQKLGIYPLGGDLFSFEAIGTLSECSLDNKVLLECIRKLSLFEGDRKKDVTRVNYAALNVEEFGSVYEGLLEYDGKFNIENPLLRGAGGVSFEFVKSSARSSSGSHYTPEELVQPLIKHSLDYVIEEKLEMGKRIASGEWKLASGEWPVESGGRASGELRMENGKEENGELRVESGKNLLATRQSPLTVSTPHATNNSPFANSFISFINGVIRNEFISRFGSMAAGNDNSRVGIQTDENISKGRDVWNDIPDTESGKFNSGEYSGRMGQAENEGVSSIYKNSKREPEGIGNSSFADSKSGDLLSGTNRNDPERMRNSKQAAFDTPKKSFSEIEINNWWNKLPLSTRYSLLASHLLLSIKVCDVAAGSGHILLSAARRIAIELARVRTGEDQPSPEPYRQALRDVINHCIYGVDKNPLAVELCKVALWLEVYNPGLPLNFLDHKIKCGDSIVGLAKREELERGIAVEAFKKMPGDDPEVVKFLTKKNKDESLGKQNIFDANEIVDNIKQISAKYKEFDLLPEKTLDDVKKKAEQYDVLKGTDWWRLKEAADVQTAQFFLPKTKENQGKVATYADYFRILNGEKGLHERQIADAMAIATEKRFFHWFLEFPDVFNDGGFDCILGNPPFLGGQKISGNLGLKYLNWLKFLFPEKGSADIVAYFFRRIYSLVKKRKFLSLLATNTIAQGDTREVGLDVLLKNGAEIVFATKSQRWPGTAALEVSSISIFAGKWKNKRILNNSEVVEINSYLDDGTFSGTVNQLYKNQNKIYMGSTIFGTGFMLDADEANNLIKNNIQNSKIIKRLLNGEDLLDNISQNPSRWVIDYSDWSLEKAQEYPDCFNIIYERVKPQREAQNIHSAKIKWWQFHRPAFELYRSIERNKKVLVVAITSKYLSFVFIKKDVVFSNAVCVIGDESYESFAFLQCAFHVEWAWKYASTLETRLRYTPSDVFETFPFPQSLSKEVKAELENIGEEYHEFRRKLMLDLQLGLTKTYNLFHNPECRMGNIEKAKEIKEFKNAKMQIPLAEAIEKIEKLRTLHKQMDEAVLKAYGWDDINLTHNFYEVDYLPENDRVRYTISPEARKEILKRLLELNHKIHAEEVAAGLWDKNNKSKKLARNGGEKITNKPPADEGQGGLF